MSSPLLEVADIIAKHGDAYLSKSAVRVSWAKKRVMRDLVACRTAVLGGHLWRCDKCGHEKIAYNACRNRHCPKCQGTTRAKWLAKRVEDLLPVEYSHVVFTVPPSLADMALQNKKVMYAILMRASAETLKQIAADPKHLGATIGFLSVLHTWTQKLLHHPHVHCVVPAGGVAIDGDRWVSCQPGFFLPIAVLRRLFRGKFLGMARQAYDQGELRFQGGLSALEDPNNFAAALRILYQTEWVVYAKPPFGSPKQVYKYLAGYTHRVAISNHRLVSLSNGQVRFRWQDRAKGNRKRIMALGAVEFTRRFLLHVLPKGFVRIRQYGLLANRTRGKALPHCRELIDVAHTVESDCAVTITPFDNRIACPSCKTGHLVCVAEVSWLAIRFSQPARHVKILDSS